jgi:hypothetical protein
LLCNDISRCCYADVVILFQLPGGVTVSLETVLLGGVLYAAGAMAMLIYSKLREVFGRRSYSAGNAVAEAVVLEYSRRLRDYDRVIADLRTRLDIFEMRAQAAAVPIQVVASQPTHAEAVSEPVAVTQHATEPGGQNGTVDYILKLLSEQARTSREVQHAIGRTREHTARLMKKLHDSGLVSRDMNVKPFRYAITPAGREALSKPAAAAPEIRRA